MSALLITNILAAGMIQYAIPVSKPTSCRITKAPVINVNPVTRPIQFDASRTADQLSAVQSGTISPYGLVPDQITAGLRHDKPNMKYGVRYHTLTDPNSNSFCISYSQIDLDIVLQPKIYVAKEYNSGQCGKEILEHEKKHVRVDRQVINKYSRQMGLRIQEVVNATPVLGPFPMHRYEEIKQGMSRNIENAIGSVELALVNEMNTLQQQVDSLEEYERVSGHCKKQREALIKKRQQQQSRR